MMCKDMVSFISAIGQYDRSVRVRYFAAFVSMHGFIADHCFFNKDIHIFFIITKIIGHEDEADWSLFFRTGRLTAVFIIRIIKRYQIRAITCKKLKPS